MKILTLQNFQAMTGGFSSDYPHRLIKGFIPHYGKLANNETEMHRKIYPQFPLKMTNEKTAIGTTLASKYITVMLANESDDYSGHVLYTTNKWEFYIHSEGMTLTDLGIPSGTPDDNTGIDAVIYNDHIVTTHPMNGTIYRKSLVSGGLWTGFGSLSGLTKHLAVIENKCLVTDSSGGAYSSADVVKIIKTDWTVVSGLTLRGYSVVDIREYLGKYALLFCVKITSDGASPKVTKNTTVFLWNANSGDSYDSRIELPGDYQCSEIKNGVIYSFTTMGDTISAYVFNGANFQKIGSIKGMGINSNIRPSKTRIGIEGDFFVFISGNTVWYWNPSNGESFVLLNAMTNKTMNSLLVVQDANSGAYERYISVYDSALTSGYFYSLNVASVTTNEASAEYNSNFIQAPFDKDVHKDSPIGRMMIDRIDIEYNVKPPSSSNSILMTLKTKDEYTNETETTYTATIKDTTANSTNATVDAKRAVITGIGTAATAFSIDLNITAPTLTWGLIIRRIVVHYQPIALVV